MNVSPSNDIALLERIAGGSELLNNSNTLVAEHNARLAEVAIGATQAAVGDLDQHLVGADLALGGSADDLSLAVALEDGELVSGDHGVVCRGVLWAD